MKVSLIVFVLLNLHLPAQTNILRGRVIDSHTREPLYKASVAVTQSGTGQITDEFGRFTFPNFNGTSLTISYVGYQTKSVSISKTISDDTLLIQLNRISIPSKSIMVSATMMKEDELKPNFEKIERVMLGKSRLNEDIPEVLSNLPSVQWYSEGGAGNGYNYLTIRGFDQRRIAVMVNGIPQNDPEDNNVYWIDFNDILSNTEVVKVQRGTGGGVFGYPAIGGAINIVTNSISAQPCLTMGSYAGSYGMYKYSADYSTGLVYDKYSVLAKFSRTKSDGYRELSSTVLNSYYFAISRFDDNFTSQFNMYGGPFEDKLVYTGLPKFAVTNLSLRKKNYSYWEADDKTFTYVTPRRPEEQEQFFQPHFELLNELNLNDRITINSALFLVQGNGYFDYDGSRARYSYYRFTKENGFTVAGNPDDLFVADAIIRAQVENKQYGWLPRVRIKLPANEINAGLEMRFHRSLHWGALQSGAGAPVEATSSYHYYEYNGGKNIFGAFINDVYSVTENFHIMSELQFNSSTYILKNEKYLSNDFTVSNIFLNPKIGLSSKLNSEMNLFASFAQVSREPRLVNYYNASEASDGFSKPQFEQTAGGQYDFSKPFVKPETMRDFELGLGYETGDIHSSINFFYMSFKNEIVNNGQVDKFGQPMTGNMESTRHIGIECNFDINVTNDFSMQGNATFSKSTISKGVVYNLFTTPDFVPTTDLVPINLSNNSISGSPGVIANVSAAYHPGDVYLKLNIGYSGMFYSDNYGENINNLFAKYPGMLNYSDNKNEAFITSKFFGSYAMKSVFGFKEIKLFAQVNNLFNQLYSAYAVGREFFPGAERNVNFGLNLSL